jgi:hypothetical protein
MAIQTRIKALLFFLAILLSVQAVQACMGDQSPQAILERQKRNFKDEDLNHDQLISPEEYLARFELIDNHDVNSSVLRCAQKECTKEDLLIFYNRKIESYEEFKEYDKNSSGHLEFQEWKKNPHSSTTGERCL